ncbi:hypothetical protein NDU88_006535 [Pleurodeles waltl]|uniref:Uncharacterized protein n=1 Tax=Pleurodeles waltl TaxID=8319 RepID=A0AAV7PLB7_PLEWA|nr:hypothetical protein NDU88_006535 [Pleurodeles waltl]
MLVKGVHNGHGCEFPVSGRCASGDASAVSECLDFADVLTPLRVAGWRGEGKNATERFGASGIKPWAGAARIFRQGRHGLAL